MTVESENETITERPIMEAMQVASSLLPHVHDLSSMTDLDLGDRLQGLTNLVLEVHSCIDEKRDFILERKKESRSEHSLS